MRVVSYIGLVVGLGLMIALVLWQGLGEIIGLLLDFGWTLLLLPVVWVPCLVPAALSWRMLFLPGREPAVSRTVHAIWIGRAINTLLATATIGGEVVKARLLVLSGTAGADAAASVLVDKSVQVFAIIAWGVVGVGALMLLSIETPLMVPILVGLLALTGGVIGFVLVQRTGMLGFMIGFAGRILQSDVVGRAHAGAGEADEVVADLYRRPGRLFLASVLKFLGLVLQVSEVWVGAYLLGLPVGFLEALMIKSLTSTLSDVAFVVPNAYGIQEGGFVLFGGMVGQPPDVMLALSLATRLRELVIDVPGLLAWQYAEGRALSRHRKPAS